MGCCSDALHVSTNQESCRRFLIQHGLKSLSWSTFCLLDSDLSTGLSYPLFKKLGPEGEGTTLYNLSRYASPQRMWFFELFWSEDAGIHFTDFGPKAEVRPTGHC